MYIEPNATFWYAEAWAHGLANANFNQCGISIDIEVVNVSGYFIFKYLYSYLNANSSGTIIHIGNIDEQVIMNCVVVTQQMYRGVSELEDDYALR